MAAVINSFEVVESIRFFAQLVSTDGVSAEVKNRANDYMLKLMQALEPSINETTASSAGLII